MDKEAPKDTVKEVKEQEVYMGEIPLMTDNGSFIINGTERVIVSQLHRSPGVFFEHDRGKTHSSGKLLFSARVIPYRGSWLDFEFDPKDFLYFRVDRRRKMPVTIAAEGDRADHRADPREFFDFDTFHVGKNGLELELVPERLRGEIARSTSSTRTARSSSPRTSGSPRATCASWSSGVKRIAVPDEFLLGRTLAHNVVDKDDRRDRRQANDEITEDLLKKLARRRRAPEIQTIYTNDLDQGPYISQTLRIDDTPDQYAAQGRDLPDDASGRAADRGRGRDAVPRPVLRRGALRPVGRRPHEVQPPRRPRAN